MPAPRYRAENLYCPDPQELAEAGDVPARVAAALRCATCDKSPEPTIRPGAFRCRCTNGRLWFRAEREPGGRGAT